MQKTRRGLAGLVAPSRRKSTTLRELVELPEETPFWGTGVQSFFPLKTSLHPYTPHHSKNNHSALKK